MNAFSAFLSIIVAVAACFSRTATANNQPHDESMRKKADEVIVLEVAGVKFCQTDIDRFWKNVDVCEPEECWQWLLSSWDGYGVFCIGGKTLRSHIVSWEISNMKCAKPLQVHHICNNSLCVNPRHLTIGTHQQNMDWMKKSGRAASGERNASRLRPERVCKGEKCHASKLNPDKVREIRKLRESGERLSSLSKIFGVRECVISEIVRYKAWKHVV